MMTLIRRSRDNLDGGQGDNVDTTTGREDRFSLTRLRRRVQAVTDNANNLIKVREALRERHANNEKLIKHMRALNQTCLERNEQKRAEYKRLKEEIAGYALEINYWKSMGETSKNTNAMEMQLNTELKAQKKRLEIEKNRLLARERETVGDIKLIGEYKKLKEGLKIAEETRSGLMEVLSNYASKEDELKRIESNSSSPRCFKDCKDSQISTSAQRGALNPPLKPITRVSPQVQGCTRAGKAHCDGFNKVSENTYIIYGPGQWNRENAAFRPGTPMTQPTVAHAPRLSIGPSYGSEKAGANGHNRYTTDLLERLNTIDAEEDAKLPKRTSPIRSSCTPSNAVVSMETITELRLQDGGQGQVPSHMETLYKDQPQDQHLAPPVRAAKPEVGILDLYKKIKKRISL